MTAIARVGGRLLLVSPAGRLLLINERIDDGSTHWLTPGGGVEDGEDPASAAVRETYEETGLEVRLDDDAEPVLVTQRLWTLGAQVYDQVDHFYVARVEQFTPDPAQLTVFEQDTLIGHRWWSEGELRATAEVLLPADVADVLAAVLG